MKPLIFSLLFVIVGSIAGPVFAADPFGLGSAVYLPVSGTIADGQIVSTVDKSFTPSSTSYDPNMTGVISLQPAVVMEDEDISGKVPVISQGKAYVLVSTQNGDINKGDPITSSAIPGVGQRGDSAGYILGNALEEYHSQNKETTAKILVTINIRFSGQYSTLRNNLVDTLRYGLSSPFLTPLTSLRYIISSVVAVGSFLFGFLYFGGLAKTGIEALGRNPLASKTIQLSIVLNILLTITIMVVGIAIAYLILVL